MQRKVRFEYFQNNTNNIDDDDPSLRRIIRRRKSAEKKNEGSEKKECIKTTTKMMEEKKNVQGRSAVPLIFSSQMKQQQQQQHLKEESTASSRTTESPIPSPISFPSQFPQHQNQEKNLSSTAKKTRDAKLQFFHGPGHNLLSLKNGTIGQSLKSLTANLKSEDFFPSSMNHSSARTRSLSPQKLPPFLLPSSVFELSPSNNSKRTGGGRWPSPLLLSSTKKSFSNESSKNEKDSKVLNSFLEANNTVLDSSKLKTEKMKKLNFAKINNHSSATTCSDSMMKRLDKSTLEGKEKATLTASPANNSISRGYRIIKGSKIINFERRVHPHLHPQQHYQSEAYEISAIDGMIWSKKV